MQKARVQSHPQNRAAATPREAYSQPWPSNGGGAEMVLAETPDSHEAFHV